MLIEFKIKKENILAKVTDKTPNMIKTVEKFNEKNVVFEAVLMLITN